MKIGLGFRHNDFNPTYSIDQRFGYNFIFEQTRETQRIPTMSLEHQELCFKGGWTISDDSVVSSG